MVSPLGNHRIESDVYRRQSAGHCRGEADCGQDWSRWPSRYHQRQLRANQRPNSMIGQDELTLVPERQTPAVQVAYADIPLDWSKPLSTGAKVGIGVAATVIGVLALVLPSHLGG